MRIRYGKGYDRHSMKRLRGNPNWGKPPASVPVIVPEFEKQVQRLKLTRADYVRSRELKVWCARNRNRVYIPEWLLEQWGIEAEAVFSGF